MKSIAFGSNPDGTQRTANLLQLQSITRIGYGNVRTLFQASKLTQLASELSRRVHAAGVGKSGAYS